MNVGAFAVVSHFANAGEKYLTLEDYAGLGRRSPMLAATLTFFLMSLIGIPITGGFFGKFYIFSAALKSNLIGLTVIGLVNSAVGAYYYLRVIVSMYMQRAASRSPGYADAARHGVCHRAVRAGDALSRGIAGAGPATMQPSQPVSCFTE